MSLNRDAMMMELIRRYRSQLYHQLFGPSFPSSTYPSHGHSSHRTWLQANNVTDVMNNEAGTSNMSLNEYVMMMELMRDCRSQLYHQLFGPSFPLRS